MYKYEPVLNKDDSLNLKNALELADVKLNRFQQEVHNAIRDDNHAPFRKLLRRCFMMEFREEQTIRILIECRRFEQEHVKPSLLSYDGAALRSQQEQHDKSLPPQTARVAVLYGFIYFRGVGLTRNKALARRYFDLGVAMNCIDAFLMAGIVRNRPDYVKKATDPLLLDIVNCTQDPDVTRLITTLRDDAPSTEKQADAV